MDCPCSNPGIQSWQSGMSLVLSGQATSLGGLLLLVPNSILAGSQSKTVSLLWRTGALVIWSSEVPNGDRAWLHWLLCQLVGLSTKAACALLQWISSSCFRQILEIKKSITGWENIVSYKLPSPTMLWLYKELSYHILLLAQLTRF